MGAEIRIALLAALCGGCIAPSVVDSSGRAVELAPEQASWSPARSEQLDGLFESLSIDGEAAASLWRVHYHFVPPSASSPGTFTGAALVLGGESPQFQTLNGEWRLVAGRIEFADGSSALAFTGGDLLKLESEGGVVVLRRVAIQ
jgi:hypothetical protein